MYFECRSLHEQHFFYSIVDDRQTKVPVTLKTESYDNASFKTVLLD